MDRRHNDQKKTTIYKTSHRKQRSPRHHTENNDLQNITQKTTISKTSHRKQRSTKHYTENNDLQNITQKTTIYKTSHRKQRSTKHHTENKRSSNKNPIKTGGVLMRSEKSSSSCTTCDTHRVTLVTNPVISHEGGKDRIVITTNVTYPLSFVTQVLRNALQSYGGDLKIST
jgi:hypothetical protein